MCVFLLLLRIKALVGHDSLELIHIHHTFDLTPCAFVSFNLAFFNVAFGVMSSSWLNLLSVHDGAFI